MIRFVKSYLKVLEETLAAEEIMAGSPFVGEANFTGESSVSDTNLEPMNINKQPSRNSVHIPNFLRQSIIYP